MTLGGWGVGEEELRTGLTKALLESLWGGKEKQSEELQSGLLANQGAVKEMGEGWRRREQNRAPRTGTL